MISSSDDDSGDDGDLDTHSVSEPVYKWIIRVDQHIDPESLEIMKLGMRSELTQVQRDRVKNPSDLYHELECRYRFQVSSDSVCLARFIYALKGLGHRRYGHRAVKQLSEFSIAKPKAFNPAAYMGEKDLKKFKFLQTLVYILVQLKEEHKTQQELIKYFVEAHLNKTNPSNIKTLCSLFTLLLESEVITEHRPDALIDAMKKIGAAHITERCNLQSSSKYGILCIYYNK